MVSPDALYRTLLADFRDRNRSVWVDIHSSLFDPRRAHHMYNDFMDELEFAAECGFDAVCVNDHHSNAYGLMPSPNLLASARACHLGSGSLRALGNSLALYNPPTRVAAEFAMINCISGGRLIAGFPVGSPMDTCFAYRQNPSLRRGAQSQLAQAAQFSRYESEFQTLAREMDAIVDKGYVIIGSSDEVAAQLKGVAVNLNVGHLTLLLQFGNIKKDLVKYNPQRSPRE